MLGEYDMKRDSVEINHRAPQWSHNAVWNRKYMEPKTGYTLWQLWADSEPAIGQKSSPSYEVKDPFSATQDLTLVPISVDIVLASPDWSDGHGIGYLFICARFSCSGSALKLGQSHAFLLFEGLGCHMQ